MNVLNTSLTPHNTLLFPIVISHICNLFNFLDNFFRSKQLTIPILKLLLQTTFTKAQLQSACSTALSQGQRTESVYHRQSYGLLHPTILTHKGQPTCPRLGLLHFLHHAREHVFVVSVVRMILLCLGSDTDQYQRPRGCW